MILNEVENLLRKREKERAFEIVRNKKFLFVELINEGVYFYFSKEYDLSIGFIELAERIAESENDRKIVKEKLAIIYGTLGNECLESEEFNKANENFTSALNLKPDAGYFYNRGLSCVKLKKYGEAINDFSNAIIISNFSFSHAYTGLGSVYGELAEYHDSLGHYEKTIELSKQSIKYSDIAIKLKENDYRAYCNRGSAYLLLEQYDRALDDFNKTIEINPKYANAYYGRGCVEKELKQYSEAIKDFNESLELDPNFAFAHYSRGLTYSILNKLEEALYDFSEAIKLGYSRAYFERGIIFAESKQYDLAIENFNKIIELNSFYEAYYARANTTIRIGNYIKALEDYNKAIKLNPKSDEAYSDRGVVYSYLKQYDRALDDFNKAIEINSENINAIANLASFHAKKGNCNEAIKYYNEAIKLGREDYDVYLSLGNVYFNLNNYEDSLDVYNKAIELKPDDFRGYSNRAVIYHELKQYDKALEDCNNSLKLNPDNYEAYNICGLTYVDLGEHTKALEEFGKAINIIPNADAYYNLGITCNLRNQYDVAIEFFNKCLEFLLPDLRKSQDNFLKLKMININIANVYHGLSGSYFWLKQYDKALENINKAIEINPEDFNAFSYYFSRGTLYFIKNQYKKSLYDYKKSLDLNPKFPMCYVNLGNVYRRQGDSKRAIKEYKRALEIDSNFIAAHINIAYLFFEQKEYNKAIEELKMIKNKKLDINVRNTFGFIYGWKTKDKQAIVSYIPFASFVVLFHDIFVAWINFYQAEKLGGGIIVKHNLNSIFRLYIIEILIVLLSLPASYISIRLLGIAFDLKIFLFIAFILLPIIDRGLFSCPIIGDLIKKLTELKEEIQFLPFTGFFMAKGVHWEKDDWVLQGLEEVKNKN